MTDQEVRVFPNMYYYLTHGLSGTECYISLSEHSLVKVRGIGITRITAQKDRNSGASADYRYKLIIPNRHSKHFLSVLAGLGYIRDLRGWKHNVPNYLYGAYFDENGSLKHDCFGCAECDGSGNLNSAAIDQILQQCQQPYTKEGSTIRLISIPRDDASSKKVDKDTRSHTDDEMEDWVAANIRSRIIKNGVVKCDSCRTQVTDGYWEIENNEEYFEDDGIDYYRICQRCTRNEGRWVSLK